MIERLKRSVQFVLAASLLGWALPAGAAVGDWAAGAKARMRLLVADVNADGTLDGAIEIALPAGWKTYWRSPGTAGIAPEFDFSRSVNMRAPDVAFPVPHRVDDGYSVTNVYEGEVILPIRAALADPAKPVEMVLTARLGVCEVICIPDEVTATLTVRPGETDPAAARIVAEARAALPGPPAPGVFAVDGVTRQGGTEVKPVFRIAATVPEGADPEVFVEGPDDWAPYAPVLVGRDGARAVYDVKFSRLGAQTPIAGARIRVILAAGGKAIEQTIGLD